MILICLIILIIVLGGTLWGLLAWGDERIIRVFRSVVTGHRTLAPPAERLHGKDVTALHKTADIGCRARGRLTFVKLGPTFRREPESTARHYRWLQMKVTTARDHRRTRALPTAPHMTIRKCILLDIFIYCYTCMHANCPYVGMSVCMCASSSTSDIVVFADAAHRFRAHARRHLCSVGLSV